MKKRSPPSIFAADSATMDEAAMQRAITNRLTFSIGKNAQNATERDWFHAIAFAVRDQFVQNWMETRARYQRSEAKRVYYLSR